MVTAGTVHLKKYCEVKAIQVDWLMYPYIANGKITLLQGDPGDGKSTMMLNLISTLTRGGKLPNGKYVVEKGKAIYQCSEDGVADTIKPRLENFNADCNRVAFIDEEVEGSLTLDDERIRQAIETFKPKLVVIDPLQAYIGSGSELYTVSKARKLMHRLSIWASYYNCAIVLIGHFTKSEGSKNLYRGIDSIDVVAAARSVLQIETDQIDPTIKIVKQVKNSLAGIGPELRYQLDPKEGFKWIGQEESDRTKESGSFKCLDEKQAKIEAVCVAIKEKLKDKGLPSTEIISACQAMGFCERTIRDAKKELKIKSVRQGGKWYWQLPEKERI